MRVLLRRGALIAGIAVAGAGAVMAPSGPTLYRSAQQVHAALEANCPIDGISIADPKVPATWRIDYRRGATAAQMAACDRILSQFATEQRATAKSAGGP